MSKTQPATQFPIEQVPLAVSRTRYPFGNLKPPAKKRGEIIYDSFFVADPRKVATLRSQASRRGKALKRKFSVRRVTEETEQGAPIDGVRIYRLK